MLQSVIWARLMACIIGSLLLSEPLEYSYYKLLMNFIFINYQQYKQWRN